MGSSGLPKTGVELVAANLQAFMGSLQKGQAGVDQFGRGMGDSSKQTSAASQVMIGALRRVGEMALDVMFKAGRALVGFGQDSLRLAGDFDQGMQNFKVAAGQGLDTKGIEEFHDLFLQLGKDLPVSTSEVQQAAVEMVKGGIDPAILAAGGLKSNIQFAAAAMSGDLVGAAEISAKIVAGWADVNATAADKTALLVHAQDLLAKAANASSVDVRELSLGLFNVQATAKNAGIGLDDVTTVLAELSGDFASSSEAGNSLASFITRLHPTTKAATEAMLSLGLVTEDGGNAFYDAQGNFIGFQKASEVLKESLQGLNNEQRQQIMQTIFQKDAMGVAAGLAARGAEGYDNMALSLRNAMGVAEAGATVQQGYNTAVENAQGGLEALKITLGEKLLPIMTDVMNYINGVVLTTMIDFAGAVFGDDEAFAKLNPTLQGFVDTIHTVVDDVQNIVGAFQDAGAGSSEFGEAIGLLASDIGLPGEIIQDLVFDIQELSTHTDEFVDTLTSALPTIAAVGAAFAAFSIITTVAGWITTAVTAVASLTAAFTAAGGGIAGVVAILGGPITLAVGAVVLAVGLLTAAWINNWGDIQGKTAAAWNYIQPILAGVGSFIEQKIFPILDDLAHVFFAAASVEVKVLSDLWSNYLWPALRAVGSFIETVLWPIFVKLFEVEWAIASKAVEAMAGLWQKVLQPAFAAVGKFITGTIVPAFTSIGDYLSRTFGPTLEKITTWLGKVTGGFAGVSSAVTKVTDFLGNLATSISKLKLPSWLTPGSPTPWETALIGIGTALNKLSPGLKTMQQGVTEIGNQIQETFESTDLVDVLENLGESLMDGLIDGMSSGMGGVVTWIESSADTLEGAWKDATDTNSPSGMTIPIGQGLMEGIMEGMLTMTQNLTQLVGNISKDLVDDMEKMADDVQAVIADSFGATASIDRQLVKNLDKMKEVLPKYTQYVEGALNEARLTALEFEDPAQGAKYFKMKSDQIFEYANLQKDLADKEQDFQAALIKKDDDAQKEKELRAQLAQDLTDEQRAVLEQQLATTTDINAQKEIEARLDADLTDKQREALQNEIRGTQQAQAEDVKANQEALIAMERLRQQMVLVNAAQAAELAQFDATKAKGPLEDLIKGINDIMLAMPANLTDDQIKIVDMLSGIWSGLQTIPSIPRTAYDPGVAAPPMTGGQYPPATGTAPPPTSRTTNVNMPIYTNNTPAALQQSWAVMQASMT